MSKINYKNNLTLLYKKSNNCKEYLDGYASYVNDLISKIDYFVTGRVAETFLQARERDSTIFFVGNGGSAATASHFAQDLGEIGRKTGKKSFKSISLCDSVPVITALGNDYKFERIFTDQMNNLFKKGDILVAISASGSSLNVVNAVKLGKRLGGVTVGFTGFDGGKLKILCDYVIHIISNKGEYGPVEDVHLVLVHMIASFLTMGDLGCKDSVSKI